MSVSRSLSQLLLLPDGLAINQGLHWRASTAHLALMRALSIVFLDPGIKVALQRLDVCVDLLTERDLVKLLQQRLMEPLADTVRLR